MASVTYDHVTKTFGDTAAVNDLLLEVPDGEFMVLVGPSGCGKSTALRMLAGLEKVSDGRILIGERVVNNIAPQSRDIAMVFQSYALYPHMTVYDNLAFGLRNQKVAKKDIDRRVRKAADILDLGPLIKRKPKQLSGGQRQRVALGRAIVREPEAFLMDEPLSNLDAKLRVQTRAEILKLQQELGTTTIYVTHDQVEAMTMRHPAGRRPARHLQLPVVRVRRQVHRLARDEPGAGRGHRRRRRKGPDRRFPAGAHRARQRPRRRCSLRCQGRGRRVPRRRAARAPHPPGYRDPGKAPGRGTDRSGTGAQARRPQEEALAVRRRDGGARQLLESAQELQKLRWPVDGQVGGLVQRARAFP